MSEVTLLLAFAGGLLSFFSPCIVPLIPAYLTHIAGTDVKAAEKDRRLQMRVFRNAVFFVLGFSAVFIALGLALAGALGSVDRVLVNRIGGLIIIAFGLQTLGLINLPFFGREHRAVRAGDTSYRSSALLGVGFGIGWTPCVSGILAAILVLAGASGAAAEGALLLTAYALGLAIPFLATGLFTSRVARWISAANRHFGIVNIVAGVLLIALGIIVFTDNFQRFIGVLSPLTGML